MKRLLFTDPITKKKSFTLTALAWSFLLFLICMIFLLIGKIQDFRVAVVALFAVAMFAAAYHQKRVKLGFTGVEIENDRRACDSN